MTDKTIGIVDTDCASVSDAQYKEVVHSVIRESVHYCFCMLFIVDPDPITDAALEVDSILRELAEAAWRGTDARLLIGGSRTNGRILDSTLLARKRAQQLGIPCRLSAAREQRSNHSKLVASDKYCLLGSHNWSSGALTSQLQDSVLINDEALAAYFASRFIDHWHSAKEDGFDVPRQLA